MVTSLIRNKPSLMSACSREYPRWFSPHEPGFSPWSREGECIRAQCITPGHLGLPRNDYRERSPCVAARILPRYCSAAYKQRSAESHRSQSECESMSPFARRFSFPAPQFSQARTVAFIWYRTPQLRILNICMSSERVNRFFTSLISILHLIRKIHPFSPIKYSVYPMY